jgi:hypothetical protein
VATGRPRRPGYLSSTWILSAFILLAANCSASAAERLAEASKIIGPRIGASAEDVANGFKSRLAGLSDEQIAAEAEKAAQRTTWIDAMLANAAQNKIKIAKVVHSAACDWIKISDSYAEGTDAQTKAWAEVIWGHIKSENLSMTPSEVEDLANKVWAQVQALQQGSFDPGSLSTDLACLF